MTYVKLNGINIDIDNIECPDNMIVHDKIDPVIFAEFRFQQGAIKESGVNGTQYDSMIKLAIHIIEKLNKCVPCRENSIAITKLEEALLWLGKRTADREKRGVEGTSNA